MKFYIFTAIIFFLTINSSQSQNVRFMLNEQSFQDLLGWKFTFTITCTTDESGSTQQVYFIYRLNNSASQSGPADTIKISEFQPINPDDTWDRRRKNETTISIPYLNFCSLIKTGWLKKPADSSQFSITYSYGTDSKFTTPRTDNFILTDREINLIKRDTNIIPINITPKVVSDFHDKLNGFGADIDNIKKELLSLPVKINIKLPDFTEVLALPSKIESKFVSYELKLNTIAEKNLNEDKVSDRISKNVNLLKMDYDLGFKGQSVLDKGPFYGYSLRFRNMESLDYLVSIFGEVSSLAKDAPFSPRGAIGFGGISLNLSRWTPWPLDSADNFGWPDVQIKYGGIYYTYENSYEKIRSKLLFESGLSFPWRLNDDLVKWLRVYVGYLKYEFNEPAITREGASLVFSGLFKLFNKGEFIISLGIKKGWTEGGISYFFPN